MRDIKDHELRELIDELRDIALRHHGSQQLRTLIANSIIPFFRSAEEAPLAINPLSHLHEPDLIAGKGAAEAEGSI